VCGAHSTVDGVRWKNVAATADYIARVQHGQSVRVDEQILTPRQRLEEALFTGLRLSAGVDRGDVRAVHGVDPWQQHEAALAPLADEGYLWRDRTRFGLTRRGMLVANEILSIFV
jgi:oxygen-independent coproporphyrinogen-3 oxidase